MAIVAKELEAKRLAPQKAAGYAIVPYEGPNGTLRRPMYIECCDAGIILQPEGVVLTAEDFRGTLGPGNPLAAAMRAAREYLMRNQRGSGEPYPLLLIRPDGIGAYYVAREALSSWGSEFGYEFVDQEWNLEYPAPDPQLLAVTSAAAEDARQRQRLLLAAAPQAFAERGGGGGGSGEVVYRASPGLGGAMVDGGGGRRGSGRRGGGSAFGGDRDKESGGLSQGGFERSGAGDGDRESENSGQGRYAEKGLPQGSARGAGSRGSNAGSSRGSGSNRSGSTTAGGTSGEGPPGDGSPEMQLASRNAENKPGEEGEPLKPGQYVAKPESMAVKRGKDWGLKEQGPRAVPISRKIRVRCQNDRLVILSDDRGAKNEQTIVFGPRAEDSVEEFVSKVWTHMDRWGIAGENMFWKPQLQFDVAPDSRGRFDEVKALLDGSGLDVAERKTSTAQTPSAKQK